MLVRKGEGEFVHFEMLMSGVNDTVVDKQYLWKQLKHEKETNAR